MTTPTPNIVLNVNGIEVIYNHVILVLKGVSFRVRPGEKVALVGATGAGKTSVVSLIARFYDPQRGCVFLDGVDVRRYRQEELRRHVGNSVNDHYRLQSQVSISHRS